MKINISCKSPILQKTLSLYLKDYVANLHDCDFVIADEIIDNINKPIALATFREDSDIGRPIYRESLLNDLSIFYKNMPKQNILDINELASLRESIDSINHTDPLKEQIDNLFSDFANKLYEILKKNQ